MWYHLWRCGEEVFSDQHSRTNRGWSEGTFRILLRHRRWLVEVLGMNCVSLSGWGVKSLNRGESRYEIWGFPRKKTMLQWVDRPSDKWWMGTLIGSLDYSMDKCMNGSPSKRLHICWVDAWSVSDINLSHFWQCGRSMLDLAKFGAGPLSEMCRLPCNFWGSIWIRSAFQYPVCGISSTTTWKLAACKQPLHQ